MKNLVKVTVKLASDAYTEVILDAYISRNFELSYAAPFIDLYTKEGAKLYQVATNAIVYIRKDNEDV